MVEGIISITVEGFQKPVLDKIVEVAAKSQDQKIKKAQSMGKMNPTIPIIRINANKLNSRV